MSELILYGVSVGAGNLALSPMPGSGGDYAADIELLGEWRPSLVVTLTTIEEMAAHGAAQLGLHIQEHGARWVHLPIADYGVPSPEFEAKWPDVSRSILAALNGGGRVLVHCRGGCGRSGMIVLRLMIEAGEASVEALERLREVRPCAVETKEQLAWAIHGGATQKDSKT